MVGASNLSRKFAAAPSKDHSVMGDGTSDTPPEPSGDARPIPAAPQEQPFLHRPIALVTLVGGVIGIVAAIVGIVVAISGAQRPAEVNESQAAVEACMVRHGLDDAREKIEGGTAGTIL